MYTSPITTTDKGLQELKAESFKDPVAVGQLSSGQQYEIRLSDKSAVRDGIHLIITFPGRIELSFEERVEGFRAINEFASQLPLAMEFGYRFAENVGGMLTRPQPHSHVIIPGSESERNLAPRIISPWVHTRANPLVIYSPENGSGTSFDPSPLMEVLGEPRTYESAVLISFRRIEKSEVVDTNWGPADADPATDVVASQWLVNDKGEVVSAGKDYPLKNIELEKRIPTETLSPGGDVLLKKPGQTKFFQIPDELLGAIHIYSPESPRAGKPQIAEKGDIIAFTTTGPWVMKWDPNKFREVSS